MVGWHHQCDGHEFEQAPGVGDGQGGLACCNLWGRKELGMTADFPSGPVVKNPPVNSWDMGSTPGLGRFHMPHGN